ncbi:hypothetical protein H9635_07735 [Solibacillus sp. A46]|uniref:Uncharacterized protein n=1 Tax=Solibacillus faecavium TaxID=2762221 RepID=A0ABR8XXH1_9BACL|nr:hypothetical protein [Solibacillus faecavium]MBD8036629.1 hypothetical protein [Solibacillus faecavium]
MENLTTQNLEKNIVTELEFVLDNNIEQIFDKCLLISGITIVNFVEASDSQKRKSITF